MLLSQRLGVHLTQDEAAMKSSGWLGEIAELVRIYADALFTSQPTKQIKSQSINIACSNLRRQRRPPRSLRAYHSVLAYKAPSSSHAKLAQLFALLD